MYIKTLEHHIHTVAWRNSQFAFFANAHTILKVLVSDMATATETSPRKYPLFQTLVPALDDHSFAETKVERIASVV